MVGSALAGALIGAAGLAWWLLSEAERRRTTLRQQRSLSLSRLQSGGEPLEANDPAEPLHERQLHQKVHELNQQIEAVRRQLEQLQPQG